MPCMDNDVLRRGKPTVHVQFGEAQALLAGDALQALAFELLTPEATTVPASAGASVPPAGAAAGSAGMAGGQAIDLASVGWP
jgi:farnesyl diphosphate synthase